jgi:hypothetical protein
MKTINGQEVWTVHMFPPDAAIPGSAATYETENGDFIDFSGQLVKEKEVLEALPEQHKVRALAWWDKRFGPNAGKVEAPPTKPAPGDQNQGGASTEQRILDMLVALREDFKVLRADVDGLKGVGKPQVVQEQEPETKEEAKRGPGRPPNPKSEKGVLKEAGIEV